MNINHPVLIASLAAAVALPTSIASAQNLKDRIDHVMQVRQAEQNNNSSKSQMLGALLYNDVTVQFQDTPARDAINYLQTVLGINLVARYNDDRTGTGLDPAAPITLNAVNRPAISVLEMVLDQAAADEPATWQLRDGYVEVGTKERLSAAGAREIRYYSIKDLLFVAPQFNNAPTLDLSNALGQGQNSGGGGQGGGGGGGFGGGGGGGQGGGSGSGTIFGNNSTVTEEPRPTEAERAQQIIDLITETVEPDAWDINGGTAASVRYYQGTLIIRAPDYIHRQIGGYPFAIRPVAGAQAAASGGSRYVMFTGGLSDVKVTGVTTVTSSGAAGGGTPSAQSGGKPANTPSQPAKP